MAKQDNILKTGSVLELLEPRILLSGTNEIPISFTLSSDTNVSLIVTNNDGEVIRELLRGEAFTSGNHQTLWDGLDENGNAVAAGNYTWKLLESDGVTSEFQFQIGTNPPFNNYGYWVGDTLGAGAFAIDPATGELYVGARFTENAPMIQRLSADGLTEIASRQQHFDGGNGAYSLGFGNRGGVDLLYMLQDRSNQDKVPLIRVYNTNLVEVVADTQSVSGTNDLSNPALPNNVMINGEAPVDMDVLDTEIVVVYADQDLIRWFSTSGGVIATESVAGARAVTILGTGGDGVVLVTTDTGEVVSLTRNNPTPVTQITGLTSPVKIDVDPTDGDIFIAEGGASQQIKRYNSSYVLQQTYGTAGGREFGLYVDTDFKNIEDITADGNGGFYVVESSAPRRTVHIDEVSGNVIQDTNGREQEWFGGQVFYTNFAVDPGDPTSVWGDSRGGTIINYTVDWNTDTWDIRGVYDTQNIGDDGLFPVRTDNGAQWKVVRSAGEAMLVHNSTAAVLRIDEVNGVLLPASVLSKAEQNGSGHENYPQPWVDAVLANGFTLTDITNGTAPVYFAWADTNSDGVMDATEFTLYANVSNDPPASHASGHITDNLDYIFTDFTVATGTTFAYSDAPRVGWTGLAGNIPTYDWNQFAFGPAAATEMGTNAINSAVYRDDAGNTYVSSRNAELGDPIYGSEVFSNETRDAAIYKYDAQGNLIGEIGATAWDRNDVGDGRFISQGFIAGVVDIPGDTNDAIFVQQRSLAGAYVYTSDGLYVGHTLDNRAADGLPDNVYRWNSDVIQYDGLRSHVFEDSSGDVFWFAPGQNDAPVYEVTGLGSLSRQNGIVSVTEVSDEPSKTGTGLRAEYYTDGTFTDLISTETVNTLNENFGSSGAVPEQLDDGFAVRWVGEIEPIYSETYRFHADLNESDSFTLTIDGATIINSTNGDQTFVTGEIFLRAGQQYDIVAEFVDLEGDAGVELTWETTNNLERQRIPSSALYTPAAAALDFNEIAGSTMFDRSYSGSDGTYFKATRVQGISGNALDFNGSDAFMFLVANDRMADNDDVTVSMWLKSTTATWTGEPILNKADSYQLTAANGGTDLTAQIETTNGTFSVSATPTNPITDWTHVAYTYDGAALSLYIDGQLANSVAATGDLIDTGRSVAVATSADLSTKWAGSVDDLKIYDRALAAADVRNQYDYMMMSPLVRIFSPDNNADEDGPQSGVYTIQRSGNSTSALTVNMAYGGEAINGIDYDLLPSSVVINAGELFKEIRLNPIKEGTFEPLEIATSSVVDGNSYVVGTTSLSTLTSSIRIADADLFDETKFEDFTGDAGDWTAFGNTTQSGVTVGWDSGTEADGSPGGQMEGRYTRGFALMQTAGFADQTIDPVTLSEPIYASGRINLSGYSFKTATANSDGRYLAGFFNTDEANWTRSRAIGLRVDPDETTGQHVLGFGVQYQGFFVNAAERFDYIDGMDINAAQNEVIDFEYSWDPATLTLTGTLTPLSTGVTSTYSVTISEVELERLDVEYGAFGSVLVGQSAPTTGESTPQHAQFAHTSDESISEGVEDITITIVPLGSQLPGIVAIYRGGEEAGSSATAMLDSSINSNDLLGTGTIQIVTDNVAPSGSTSAMLFGGVGAYYPGGPPTDPITTATDNFVFEAWVLPNSSDEFFSPVFRNGSYAFGGSNRNGYNFGLLNGNWSLRYPGGAGFDQSLARATIGEWQHIAFVRNNGENEFYVNGILRGTSGIDPVTPLSGENNFDNPGGFSLGASYNSYFGGVFDPFSGINGLIDETRIYTFDPGTFDINETFWATNYAGTYKIDGNDTVSFSVADGAPVSLTSSDTEESEFLSDSITFTVNRSTLLDGILDVNYTLTGSAVEGVDFTSNIPLNGTFSFADQQSEITVVITPIDDTNLEGFETIGITLDPGPDYAIISGQDSLALSIADDDEQSGLNYEFFNGIATLDGLENETPDDTGTVSEISVQPAYDNGANNNFSLRFTGNLYVPQTGDYTFTLGQDDGTRLYINGNQIINNAGVGSSSTTINLTSGQYTIEIRHYEGSGGEQVFLNWSGPGIDGTQPLTSPFIGTGLPATEVVRVHASDNTATENSGDTATFTFSRPIADANAITVNYETSNTSTVDPSDFTPVLTGTIDIPANQTSVDLVITTTDDNVFEGIETLTLTILSDANYTLGSQTQATINIVDDDPAAIVDVVASDPNADEATGDPGQFTITRSGNMNGDITVNYTISGSANANASIDQALLGLSPLAYWHLNGNGLNAVTTGNNYDGTWTDGTAEYISGLPQSTEPGNLGAQFDNNKYLNINNADDFNFAVTDTFSATAWINHDPLIAGDEYIVGKMNNSGDRDGWALYLEQDGTLSAYLRQDGQNELRVQSLQTVTDAQWHLVGFTYDGSATPEGLKLYIDGQQVAVTVPENELETTDDITSTARMTLGSRNVNNEYEGQLDEVAVWSRTLSDADIQAIQAAGSPAEQSDVLEPISGSITLLASQTSATIDVTPFNDQLLEGAENLTLTLDEAQPYDVGANSSATVVIADAGISTVTLSATNPSASEVGPDAGQFTISRGSDTQGDLTVEYAISGTFNNTDLHSETVLSTNPLAYWRLNGDTLDAIATGNNHDGTWANGSAAYDIGTTLLDDPDQLSGVFDNDRHVDIANADDFSFTAADSFSAAAWVKVDSDATGYLISKMDNGNRGWALWMDTSSGGVRLRIGQNTSNEIDIRTSQSISDGDWHHVMFTYDGSTDASGVAIYVDGLLVANNVSDNRLDPGEDITNTALMSIGSRNGNNGFQGQIDEAVVWDRVVTAEEVADMVAAATVGLNSDLPSPLIGTVVIPDGQSFVTIDINPVDDLTSKPVETVTLTLIDTINYDVGMPDSDTVSITDAGEATVTIHATDDTAAEDTADPGQFTVTRSGNLQGDLTVNYQVSGSAQPGAFYSDVVQELNPLAYWRLDGNGLNEITSGNNYDGTWTDGTAAYIPGTPLINEPANQGALFDNNKYLNINNADDFNFQVTDSFSAIVWFNRSNTISGDEYLIGKMDNGGDRDGWAMYLRSDGTLSVYLRQDGPNDLRLQSVGSFTDGNWHQASFTYDGSGSFSGLKLFVDGQ